MNSGSGLFSMNPNGMLAGAANGLFQKNNDFGLNWITLDPNVIELMYSRHKSTDPMSQQCRRFILQKIGTEIMFKKGNITMIPKGEFKNIVDNEWSKLIHDVYDCLMITGLVPIEFSRHKGVGTDLIPKVPPIGTYVIQMAYVADIGRTIYRVIRPKKIFFSQSFNVTDSMPPLRKGMEIIMRSQKSKSKNAQQGIINWNSNYECQVSMIGNMFGGDASYDQIFGQGIPNDFVLDRNIIVLSGFGYDPMTCGTLTSVLFSIEEDRKFMKLLQELMMTAQVKMVSQPLYVEKEVETTASSDIVSKGFKSSTFVMDDLTKTQKFGGKNGGIDESNPYISNSSEEERMRLISLQKVIEMYHGLTINSGSSGINHLNAMSQADPNRSMIDQGMERVRQSFQRVAEIPAGYRLPSGQKIDSTAGQRYFDIRDDVDEITCRSYGIPRPLLTNEGVVKANSEEMQKFVQDTVVDMSKKISNILTTLYSMIYSERDEQIYVESAAELLERPVQPFISEILTAASTGEWVENGGNVTKRRPETEGRYSYFGRNKTCLHSSSEDESDYSSSDSDYYSTSSSSSDDDSSSSSSDYDDDNNYRDKADEKTLGKKLEGEKETFHLIANKTQIQSDTTSKEQVDKETSEMVDDKNSKTKKSNVVRFPDSNQKESERLERMVESGGSGGDFEKNKSNKKSGGMDKMDEKYMQFRKRPESLNVQKKSSQKGEKRKGKSRSNNKNKRQKTRKTNNDGNMSNRNTKINQILEEPIRVIVNSEKTVMDQLLESAYQTGAMTDSEYWIIKRSQLGLRTDDETIRKLIDQDEWRFNRENPPQLPSLSMKTENNGGSGGSSVKSASLKNTSSSSSRSSRNSDGNKDRERRVSYSKPEGGVNVQNRVGSSSSRLKTKSSSSNNINKKPGERPSGKTEGEASSSTKRKRQKQRLGRKQIVDGKLRTKPVSQSNMKRSMSARKKQTYNAKKGRKSGRKSLKPKPSKRK